MPVSKIRVQFPLPPFFRKKIKTNKKISESGKLNVGLFRFFIRRDKTNDGWPSG